MIDDDVRSSQVSLELARSLKKRHVTMISIGGIIGAGLFVGSSAAIATAGPAIILSYLLAGVLILLIMRMLGEMALVLPKARVFPELVRAALGDGAGFVCGWLYWYFWIIVVPIEAVAGAALLQGWIPLPVWQLGLGLMAILTAVNLMSARSYGEFEFWFASIKVAAIIVFMSLAAAYALGWISNEGAALENLTSHGGFMPHGAVAALAGTVAVFFSLTGAEVITVAAAESSEPASAVARMTTSVVVRILIFYVGSVSLILLVVPWNSVIIGESPFTLALRSMGLTWASTAMSVVILTAVLSCLNSAFYVCSRILFVLAERGDAPHWLVQLNARSVPSRSVWVAALAGVLGVLAATFAPQTVFAFLVNASGALILFIYILIGVAQIRLRRERERRGIAPSPVSVWLFPWSSWVAIGGMLAVLIAMAMTPNRAMELAVSLVSLAVAVLAYRITVARRRRLSSATECVSASAD